MLFREKDRALLRIGKLIGELSATLDQLTTAMHDLPEPARESLMKSLETRPPKLPDPPRRYSDATMLSSLHITLMHWRQRVNELLIKG